jgi:hypothetical protein
LPPRTPRRAHSLSVPPLKSAQARFAPFARARFAPLARNPQSTSRERQSALGSISAFSWETKFR